MPTNVRWRRLVNDSRRSRQIATRPAERAGGHGQDEPRIVRVVLRSVIVEALAVGLAIVGSVPDAHRELLGGTGLLET